MHVHTPSTAVKIRPGKSQPPMKPHVNPLNIPRLLPFKLTINATYTDHNQRNTTDQRLFCYSFVFPYNNAIQQRTEASLLRPQTSKHYNCTYLPCAWNTDFFPFFKLLFCFGERETKRKWRLANLFSLPPPPPPPPPPPSCSVTYSFCFTFAKWLVF